MRLASLILSLAVLTLTSVDAFAADDDTVWLADGGRVRGTVMEESPTTGVKVKLADGTVRAFTPAQVKKVDYAAPAAPAAPAPAPTQAVASGRPIPPGAAVTVHLASDNPDTTLQVVNANFVATGPGGTAVGTDTSVVCTLPCDQPVDANFEYRVGGKGVTPSSHFLLPRDKGTVSLEVEAGSQSSYGLGLLGGTLGATTAIMGGAFLLVGAVSDKEDWAIGGGITAAIGVAVAIPCYILMGSSLTTVKTKDGVELAVEDSDVRLTARGIAF